MKTLPARILALLAFLCCGSSLLAEPPTKQATLTQIQLFAFGGIGVAGTTSAGELLYRQVLASEQAEAQFLALVKNGTPAAKCYALVGLRAKNRAAFEEQADALAKDPSPVETASGCELTKQPLASIVTRIKKGEYDTWLKESK